MNGGGWVVGGIYILTFVKEVQTTGSHVRRNKLYSVNPVSANLPKDGKPSPYITKLRI